jgi:hypothetical protein
MTSKPRRRRRRESHQRRWKRKRKTQIKRCTGRRKWTRTRRGREIEGKTEDSVEEDEEAIE